MQLLLREVTGGQQVASMWPMQDDVLLLEGLPEEGLERAQARVQGTLKAADWRVSKQQFGQHAC
jgi:hypothetical protein